MIEKEVLKNLSADDDKNLDQQKSPDPEPNLFCNTPIKIK